MSEIETTQQSDERWYSIVGGLLVVPVTVISYWQTGSAVSITSITWVVLTALVIGYVARFRSAYDDGIGIRVGAIGGLPVLWKGSGIGEHILGVANPQWFTVLSLVLLVGSIVGFVGLFALFGKAGATVGCRLADRTGRGRRVSHS